MPPNQPILKATYTPDDEPYLGRETVFAFDEMIIAYFEKDTLYAAYTHSHSLTELQLAACQIIPQGINLACTIRELVRQGYLFGAAVLMRSLIERVAIIAYLYKNPEAITLWHSGWNYNGKDRRPSLKTMIKSLGREFPEVEQASQEIVDMFNHITHGDPVGARWNMIQIDAGSFGYSVSKTINEPELCDFVCLQAAAWLAVLLAMRSACFPEISLD